jgi:hypothetical protein
MDVIKYPHIDYSANYRARVRRRIEALEVLLSPLVDLVTSYTNDDALCEKMQEDLLRRLSEANNAETNFLARYISRTPHACIHTICAHSREDVMVYYFISPQGLSVREVLLQDGRKRVRRVKFGPGETWRKYFLTAPSYTAFTRALLRQLASACKRFDRLGNMWL